MNQTEIEPVRLVAFDQFESLLAELEKPERSRVRLARVDDQGLVEGVPNGRGFLMQPRVRIAVTILDYVNRELFRWETKFDVGMGVAAINPFAPRGSPYADPSGVKTQSRVTAALEARGLLVTPGEWTPESATAALADAGG